MMRCLPGNICGADGARAIGEGIKSCPSLTSLNLECEWAQGKGEDKASRPLTWCALPDNDCGDDGAWAIGEGIKSCPSLTSLDLYSEWAQGKGEDKASRPLTWCAACQGTIVVMMARGALERASSHAQVLQI